MLRTSASSSPCRSSRRRGRRTDSAAARRVVAHTVAGRTGVADHTAVVRRVVADRTAAGPAAGHTVADWAGSDRPVAADNSHGTPLASQSIGKHPLRLTSPFASPPNVSARRPLSCAPSIATRPCTCNENTGARFRAALERTSPLACAEVRAVRRAFRCAILPGRRGGDPAAITHAIWPAHGPASRVAPGDEDGGGRTNLEEETAWQRQCRPSMTPRARCS